LRHGRQPRSRARSIGGCRDHEHRQCALQPDHDEKRRVEQSNYTDYLVPRIDITPETHVYFVENTHLPGGVGEPGVPPTAPAICNAIYAATSKRIRALPVDPQLLKA